MKRRLIYCRTPLQSLIAGEIQNIDPACDTVVYRPISDSPKHRQYFERMKADTKLFLEWRPDGISHLLTELASSVRIPRQIREADYDTLLISSVDTLKLLCLRPERFKTLETFDDGAFNLLESAASALIDEPWHYELFKRAFGLPMNRQFLKDSSRHFTIFEEGLLPTFRRNSTYIPLFDEQDAAEPMRGQLTVLLGTYTNGFDGATSSGIDGYSRVRASARFDIFLPHPAEDALPNIRVDALASDAAFMTLVETAIAEEIILYLRRKGYSVQVYGLSSTALITMSACVESFNVIVPGLNDRGQEAFEALGVQSVPTTDF